MPTPDGSIRHYPDTHLPPRKFALVVSCIDCRLLDDLVRFLDHDNLNNRYYHVAFAGASIGLTDRAPAYPAPSPGRERAPAAGPRIDFAQWRQALQDHIRLVIKLTGNGLTDVYVVEHADCGAYKEFLGTDYYADPAAPAVGPESDAHKAYALALKEQIGRWFAGGVFDHLKAELRADAIAPPLVHGFLMDLRGSVAQLFGPG